MYYPCSENKDADQLRGYREADLRLCFRPCKLLVFSRTGSFILHSTHLNIHTVKSILACVCEEVTTNLDDRKYEDVWQEMRNKGSMTKKGAASWENQQCGFRTVPTQTGLYRHRRWLEAGNFGFRK